MSIKQFYFGQTCRWKYCTQCESYYMQPHQANFLIIIVGRGTDEINIGSSW